MNCYSNAVVNIGFGTQYFTNGTTNIRIYGSPPPGFWPGKTLSEELLEHLSKNNPASRKEVRDKLRQAWANNERKAELVARNKKGGRAVQVGNVVFISISECAKYFQVDCGTVKYRANSPKFIDWIFVSNT